MMKVFAGSFGFGMLVVCLLGIIGWIANAAQVVGLVAAGEVTAMFVLKVVGIFAAPLGSVLGLIGLF